MLPRVLLIACSCAVASIASAVPPEPAARPTASGVLRVPGGTAALLEVAGLDPGLPRARALLDIIRVVHEVGDGVDAELDARRSRLVAYLEALSAFEGARQSFSSGVTLASASDKRERKHLEAFADAMGFSLERDGGQTTLVAGSGERAEQRRAALVRAGFDPAAAAAQLNHGESIAPSLRADEVPLPLPNLAWQSRDVNGAVERLQGTTLAAILGDRKASLLYYGLCAVDGPTLAYLASKPSVSAAIYNSNQVGTMALYGRSLRVRDGRVAVPGGGPAVPLWEKVAGEATSNPEKFFVSVLSRDGGRLALLYDAIAQLDEDAQAFALGLSMGDANAQLDRFRDLYAASAVSLAGWNPLARPFSRPLYDPAHVLLATTVGAGGAPLAPAARRFWQQVFDSDEIPQRPADALENVDRDGPVDAAALISLVCVVNSNQRRERAEAWLFGHRVFGAAPAADLPDQLVALRGYQRFRSLADTLERLDVVRPAVYAAAMRRAQRLAEIGDPHKAATAIASFQGGLVLIERARLARVLDVATTERLVASLSRVDLTDDHEFLGGVARWLVSDYLAAIPAKREASTVEDQVLRAFSGGAIANSASSPVVEIEGIRYHVDPAAPVYTRVQAVRERQASWLLDEVLAFGQAVDALASGVRTLPELQERRSALQAAGAPLLARPPGPEAFVGTLDLGREFEEALEDLAKIDTPNELKKVEAAILPLRRTADRCLALVLASLAYAPSLGEAEGSVLVAGDPSPRHEFGLRESNGAVRVRNPWGLPVESHEGSGTWHVTGGLLGLDVGLGKLGLRRISTDSLPEPPVLKANQRLAFTEAVVLANPFDYREDALAGLVRALRAGRARVATLAASPDGLPEVLQHLRVDPARREMLAWTVAHEPERVAEFFSAAELVQLGRGPEQMEALGLWQWGTSGWSLEGALRLRVPPSRHWATLGGRQGKGLTAALVPDLSLLVAEVLAEHGLPVALVPSIMAAATQDVIDGLRPSYEDDWLGMVAQIQRLVPQRADDYVNSVITGGVLVPAVDGGR